MLGNEGRGPETSCEHYQGLHYATRLAQTFVPHREMQIRGRVEIC